MVFQPLHPDEILRFTNMETKTNRHSAKWRNICKWCIPTHEHAHKHTRTQSTGWATLFMLKKMSALFLYEWTIHHYQYNWICTLYIHRKKTRKHSKGDTNALCYIKQIQNWMKRSSKCSEVSLKTVPKILTNTQIHSIHTLYTYANIHWCLVLECN